jgi:hypothetical protein
MVYPLLPIVVVADIYVYERTEKQVKEMFQ